MNFDTLLLKSLSSTSKPCPIQLPVAAASMPHPGPCGDFHCSEHVVLAWPWGCAWPALCLRAPVMLDLWGKSNPRVTSAMHRPPNWHPLRLPGAQPTARPVKILGVQVSATGAWPLLLVSRSRSLTFCPEFCPFLLCLRCLTEVYF